MHDGLPSTSVIATDLSHEAHVSTLHDTATTHSLLGLLTTLQSAFKNLLVHLCA